LNFRHAAVACSAAIALAGAAWAVGQQATPAASPGPAAAPPAPPAAKPASGPTAHPDAAVSRPGKPQKAPEKPLWRDLTPAQQTALQPLVTEWDQMNGVRKQKWLEMANRFSSIKPEEQQRLHERMREWIRLTPAQRKLARDTYARTRKLAPGEKTATWESYQQLPEEQKQKLAAAAAARKQGAARPAPANPRPGAVLQKGSTACPAGTVKNPVSATPPCVPAASAPAAPGAPAGSAAVAVPAQGAPAAPAATTTTPTVPATPASNAQ
jgi:Protein of unknown function (DUF3106)